MFNRRRMHTPEDILNLMRKPENTGRRFELVDGAIVETSMDSSGTAAVLSELLQEHVSRNRLGRVVTNTAFRRANDLQNVRVPDVAYISFERTMPLNHEGVIPSMPDLVVLVQTPDVTTTEIADRSLYYLKNGTTTVWIAHPDTATVDVCSRGSHGQVRVFKVAGESALMGNDLLPGLMVVVHDIFHPREKV